MSEQEETLFIKQQPYNAEAEQSVLGAVMLDQSCLAKVAQNLKEEDFYLRQHRIIYRAMVDIWNRNGSIDAVTLSEQLGADLEAVGGYAYSAQIAQTLPTTQHLDAYIDIVADMAIRRRLIDAASHIANISYDKEDDLQNVLSDAESSIYNILQQKRTENFSPVGDVLFDSFEHIHHLFVNRGKTTGVPTGFRDLDIITTGLQPSELIIIAARPAMGKSSFVLNVAINAAKAGVPVALFNLEMSKEQLGTRLIWSESMISGEKIKSGNISDDDWTTLAKVVGHISGMPLYIDDSPGLTITEMRAKCKKLQLEHGIGLVIIDYLQLMQGGRRIENRQQEISEISRGLKVLAKELNVPVIALSQLSRATANRTDHKPILSDLRESGAIEQDADIVMFLHREDYYNEETEKKGIAECIIAKHRNGPVCTVERGWKSDITRFVTLDRQHME